MRQYQDNFEYIGALIQDLQSRGSSPVERRSVKSDVEGSIPSHGEACKECHERTYDSLVDSGLFDSCRLDN